MNKNRFYLILVAMTLFISTYSAPTLAQDGCHLSVPKLAILSAPVATVLNALGLLNRPEIVVASHVLGLNAFNPKTKLLPHTLFLSGQSLKELEGTVVFYDQSRELKKTLKNVAVQKLIEVKTRDLDPFEVVDLIVKQLLPLTDQCQEEFATFAKLMSDTKVKCQNLQIPSGVLIFLLGDWKSGGAMPELMMNNDGPMIFLRKNMSRTYYPSTLAYLAPSQKILEKLKAKERLLFVGLSSQDRHTFVSDVRTNADGSKVLNIFRPEFLIPGFPQVMFLFELQSLLQVLEDPK